MTETWTVRRLLQWTSQHFEKQGVDSSRLTAEVLLAHSLHVDRVKLYMDIDRPLNKDELATYRSLVLRRTSGEPTQYLTGSREFYNRNFKVDERVLVPRPETELLVDGVLPLLSKDAASRVVDLCTGSGCIALTIAAERTLAEVWATDISPGACDVARANAQALNLGTGVEGERVQILEGDLFAPLLRLKPEGEWQLDVVVSNPPYIKADDLSGLPREVRKEPRQALDGGTDGLQVVRRIAETARGFLKTGGWLALEIGDDQGPQVHELLSSFGYEAVRVEKDFARHDRLAFGRYGAAASPRLEDPSPSDTPSQVSEP